ncbi:MAG: hypothetical protein ACLR1V_00420 [Coprococcus sp.]
MYLYYQDKASEYNQAVVEYSAQISERNKNIDDLQNQITDLQSKLSQYESTVGNTVDDAGASEQKLIEAARQLSPEQCAGRRYADC